MLRLDKPKHEIPLSLWFITCITYSIYIIIYDQDTVTLVSNISNMVINMAALTILFVNHINAKKAIFILYLVVSNIIFAAYVISQDSFPTLTSEAAMVYFLGNVMVYILFSKHIQLSQPGFVSAELPMTRDSNIDLKTSQLDAYELQLTTPSPSKDPIPNIVDPIASDSIVEQTEFDETAQESQDLVEKQELHEIVSKNQ
eukprot:NODE_121_length_17861_cov_0.498480.p9 type:complete len:200 gc:universal NODE_121_length_17861_cov_0.498480:13019-13618(+)